MPASRRFSWVLLLGGLAAAAACTTRLTSQEPRRAPGDTKSATAKVDEAKTDATKADAAPAANAKADELIARRELRDIAERAFDETSAFYESGEASPYEVNQASRRWLDQELALAGSAADKTLATQAHLDRMRDLANYALWRSSELEYFVAEAELDLNALAPNPKFGPTIEARKALQGEWEVVSAAEDGAELKKPDLKSLTIVGRRGEFSFRLGAARALIGLDPTSSPREFDVFGFNEAFPFGGRGIYKLDDGELTICWTSSGERPSDFSTQPDDNAHLYVLRRGGAREK